MNENLKNIFGFIICIGLLIGIGFYTGFFSKYGIGDVQNVITDASNDILNLNTKNRKDLKIRGKNNTSRINDYRANNIPRDVIDGYKLSGFWRNVFGSDKKVIFYVYDSSGSNSTYSLDFHKKISNSYNSTKLSSYYNLEPSDLGIFKNYNVGLVGSTKICNSLDECNKMREKATKRAAMQMFLDKCAANFCIINMKNNEFVMLRNKDYNEALKALKALQNW